MYSLFFIFYWKVILVGICYKKYLEIFKKNKLNLKKFEFDKVAKSLTIVWTKTRQVKSCCLRDKKTDD